MRHCGLLLLASFLALGLGCKKKEAKPKPKPKTVSVLRLEPQTVRVYREYVGRTDAFLTVDLRPQVSAFLKGFFFKEGHEVHKGQLLFQLDARLYQAAVDAAIARLARADADVQQAQAQLSMAEDYARRYAPLATIEAIPRQQYTDALAQVQVRAAEIKQMQANQKIAQASLDEAKVNLSYTAIRAPISGIIGFRRLTTGGLAGSSDPLPLATISQSNPLRVSFSIADADYLKYLAPGATKPGANKGSAPRGDTNTTSAMDWKLMLADGTVYDKPGKFYAISRAANVQTDTIEVVLLYPNAENRLRPGQYAKVRADVELRKNVLLIPVTCVREVQGTKTVSVLVPGNTVAERTVDTEARSGNSYIVLKGLAPGDAVIVGGEQKVKPGDTVKPQWTQAEAAGAGGEPKTLGGNGETSQPSKKASTAAGAGKKHGGKQAKRSTSGGSGGGTGGGIGGGSTKKIKKKSGS